MLTDRDGVLLNYIGDPSFTDTAAQVGIQTGAVWSEAVQGTNGMGTCLVEKKPWSSTTDCHFFERNAGLTCAAAPIFDPNGEVLAILDASSEATLAQQHTMVLLNMSAQVIENRVFFCAMQEAYVFRCHSRVEFIGTLGEGLIAFTTEGRILAVNRSAIFQLDLQGPEQIVGRFIHDLFTISLPMLIKRAHSQGGAAFPIHETRSERRFFAKIQAPEHCSRPEPAPVIRPHLVGEARSTPAVIGPFETLHFGDPRMERNIATIMKVLDRDIPCLLLGETGVGKDVFARAIHQASPRRDKPFVALNCASLPESLIESELFGYKGGAFTGANREGSRGKIRPGRRRHPVSRRDRRHAGASSRRGCCGSWRTGWWSPWRRQTHPSLHPTHQRHAPGRAFLIAQGQFREDLYYRIHGVSLTIPPLRERADRRELVLKVAQDQAGPERHPGLGACRPGASGQLPLAR